MKKRGLVAFGLVSVGLGLVLGVGGGCEIFPGSEDAAEQPSQGLSYPVAERGTQTDVYHGQTVADPYRWLEDTESAKARVWIEEQNRLTDAYFAAIPQRETIKARLTQLWDYEKFGTPFTEGGRYFYSRNSGLQNQSVFYTTDSLGGEARVLIDPNEWSTDGTVSPKGYTPSRDGRYLAYGMSTSGSDWEVWKVRDIDTGTDLDDRLEWVKFSGASWAADSSGFYYSRYPEVEAGQVLTGVNKNQKLYFHKIGTPQSEDVLVYERPDQPDWGFGAGVSDDGRYLNIVVWSNVRENALFYKDLSTPNSPVVELLNKWDAQYSPVGNDGAVFWVQTDKDAPNSKVIAIDTAHPDPAGWTTVIAEAPEALQGVGVVGGKFFASSLKDAKTQVRIFDLAGNLEKEVEFPGVGSAGGFGGRVTDTETFYSFTGFTSPTTTYRYDIATGQSSVFRAPKVDFDPSKFTTEQVFFSSKDGTQVPMFITYKKGLKKNGQNPTLLYGYGGFNVPLTPGFSVSNVTWMEMGGVYAMANLRGGSEYGEDWHQAGTKTRKQNVFDDFIAAAEYLINEKYTSSPKLGINGGSNGGLLVAACMNQRPELFGACIPQVGVMDMLRFQEWTAGRFWVADYGSRDIAEEFAALYAYSPIHNLKRGTCYPPTLVTTADHDDRVFPGHSFKYAAALQYAQDCENPCLIRIETKAGHGAGKPTTKIIEEAADKWAFLVKELGVK
jgi:prolyl oligopeptidase